jgi:heme A synthase
MATGTRRTPIALLVISACFFVVGTAGTAAAAMPDFSESPTPDSTTAPPATDAPVDTSPADTSPPDADVPGDETTQEEDEGVDVAPIAIVGFVILVAIAGWWMVRRDDADDQPSPPPSGEPQWRPDQVAP